MIEKRADEFTAGEILVLDEDVHVVLEVSFPTTKRATLVLSGANEGSDEIRISVKKARLFEFGG